MPARSVTADQEQNRRHRVVRTLVHHIGADRFERRRLVQIDYAFGSRLAAHAARMIESDPDGHAPPAVGYVGEVKAQHLAGAKAAVEHQADQCQVAATTQLGNQCVDMLTRHGTRHAMHVPQPHGAARRRL